MFVVCIPKHFKTFQAFITVNTNFCLEDERTVVNGETQNSLKETMLITVSKKFSPLSYFSLAD